MTDLPFLPTEVEIDKVSDPLEHGVIYEMYQEPDTLESASKKFLAEYGYVPVQVRKLRNLWFFPTLKKGVGA